MRESELIECTEGTTGRACPKPHPGSSIRASAIGTTLALLFLSPAVAAPPDKQAVRKDALTVMAAAISVTTGALYCNKHIKADPQLVEAAEHWSERHRAYVERVVQAIEWSGGESDEEKELMNKRTFEQWGRLDVARCEALRADMENGALDLDKRPETAPALQRIMSSEFP